MFINYLNNNYRLYDIEPEDIRIQKQDYLTLDLPYKKGRCIIGNSPFGVNNTLSVKFYKQSLKFGDYISFILPISQLNNNQQMYEFDLVYSENLGKLTYTDRELHCCLNIYKRNFNGLNPKQNYKLKDVTIIEFRRNGTYKKPINFDFGMCSWGAIGKEVEYVGQYAQENYFYVNNIKFKEQILKLCKETNWKELHPYISTPKIQTWKIYKYIKEQIPEIE